MNDRVPILPRRETTPDTRNSLHERVPIPIRNTKSDVNTVNILNALSALNASSPDKRSIIKSPNVIVPIKSPNVKTVSPSPSTYVKPSPVTSSTPVSTTVKQSPVSTTVKQSPVSTTVKQSPVSTTVKQSSLNTQSTYVKPSPVNTYVKPSPVNTLVKPSPVSTTVKSSPNVHKPINIMPKLDKSPMLKFLQPNLQNPQSNISEISQDILKIIEEDQATSATHIISEIATRNKFITKKINKIAKTVDKKYTDVDIAQYLSNGYIKVDPTLWDYIPIGAELCFFKKSKLPRNERFRVGGFLLSVVNTSYGKKILRMENRQTDKDFIGYAVYPIKYDDIEEIWKKYDKLAFIEIHLICSSLAQKKQQIEDLNDRVFNLEKTLKRFISEKK
jgi:hypothetical protein